MNNRRATLKFTVIALLSILLLAGLVWVNYSYALIDTGMDAFLPCWAGTKGFLSKGISPYSQAAIREIENLAYSRSAHLGEEQGLFMFPFYSLFVFTPFALLDDYLIARSIWMVVLELSIIGIIWIGVSLCQWRPSRFMVLILFFFSVLWYHHIRPIVNSEPLILTTFFILLMFYAIYREHDAFAGFMLALSTINIGPILLLIVFVLGWAVSHRRWNVIWGFFASLGFLMLSSIILLPDWIGQYARQSFLYYTTTFNTTPGNLITNWLPGIGRQTGWAITITMTAVLLVEWRRALKQDFRWFLWTACLTLVATTMIGLRASLDNYAYLSTAVILVLTIWDQRWGKFGNGLIVISIVILTFGLWGISINGAQNGISPDKNLSLYFYVPTFLIVALYWVRYWATHSTKLFLERLSERLR